VSENVSPSILEVRQKFRAWRFAKNSGGVRCVDPLLRTRREMDRENTSPPHTPRCAAGAWDASARKCAWARGINEREKTERQT